MMLLDDPMLTGCSISGLGIYLPSNRLTNDYFANRLDTSDQWIVERTGIHERRQADANDATSDLACRAALAALQDARLNASDLDLIILATSTADSPVPATACHVQAKLAASASDGGGVGVGVGVAGVGVVGGGAMDISAGCSGFGYALHVGVGLIRAGMHRRVLVVGADCLTRVTNYADRQSCILFGDGAGAAVLESTGVMDVIYSDIGADGSSADLIRILAGGSRRPATKETVDTALHALELRGREVFKAAVRQMSLSIAKAASALGIRPADFDLIIPHQANARIIEAVGSHLEADPKRVLIDVGGTGNTAAASIPLALAHARESGRLRVGDRVAMVGFGAGTAWACQVLQIKDRPS